MPGGEQYLEDLDAVALKHKIGSWTLTQPWNLHICALDRDCRRYAPGCWRLELNTPWFHFGQALTADSRYVGNGEDDRSYWTSFRRVHPR